jgi:hypothetical protein
VKSEELKISARKRDEAITNSILIVFSISLFLLLAVMLVSRNMNSFTMYADALSFCTAASIAFGIVGTGFMTLAFMRYKKKAAIDKWLIRFIMTGGIALLSAVIFLYIRLYTFRSFGVLYAAIPIAAFLYMIFNIYQREFFYQTLVVGCSGGTLYAFSRWLHNTPWAAIVHIVYILAISLLIAAALFLLLVKKHKGTLFRITLLPQSTNYNMMFITLGVMLLSIAAVLVIPGIAFWGMIGVFGYLFVLAVYYTIKLM